MITELMMAVGYYFANPSIARLVEVFYQAGLKNGGMVPACCITGLPGAGKTFLAEAFGKAISANVIFYQCTAATDSSTLIGDINPAAVVQGRGGEIVTDGALLKLAKADVPSVLVLDEWDKGGPELDAFLLDVLQNRRIRNYNGEQIRLPDSKIWVFLTSNGDRPISDALSRRVRKWDLEKMSGVEVASILGLDPKHDLIRLWECLPSLALSQLQSYVDDFGGVDNVPEHIDAVIMGQYIDLSGIDWDHLGDETNSEAEDEVQESSSSIKNCCTSFVADVEAAGDVVRLARNYIPDGIDNTTLTYKVDTDLDWDYFVAAVDLAKSMYGKINIDIKNVHAYCGEFGLTLTVPRKVLERNFEVVVGKNNNVLIIGKNQRPYVGEVHGLNMIKVTIPENMDEGSFIGGLL